MVRRKIELHVIRKDVLRFQLDHWIATAHPTRAELLRKRLTDKPWPRYGEWEQVAAETGYGSSGSVRSRACQLGFKLGIWKRPENWVPRWNKGQDRRLLEMRAKGMEFQEIARILGHPVRSCKERVRKLIIQQYSGG